MQRWLLWALVFWMCIWPASVLAVDPIAHFQLDEYSLDGTAGEIVDAMGNFNGARAVGSGVVPTANGKVCWGVDIPANDGATVAGIDTGIDVNGDIGDRGAISFWYFSYRAWDGNGDHVLFDASTPSGKFFYLVLLEEGNLRFGLEDSNDNDRIMETPLSARGARQWAHVVASWDTTTDSYALWVDGVELPLHMVEEQNSRPTGRLGNMGSLMFGDTQSSYHYGGSNHSADGVFDEIRVYDEIIGSTQISADRAATRFCAPPSGSPSDLFNCVEVAGDPIAGRLLTRVVGSAFSLDIVALEDSDRDGVTDTLNTRYPVGRDRTVSVELIDTSVAADCWSYPSLGLGTTQGVTFTRTDYGRVTSAAFSLGKAYRSVGCRVIDPNGRSLTYGCSRDRFAVRPAALTLEPPTLNNAGPDGTPVAVAGDEFSLTVTASAGYDGTPQLAGSLLEAHVGAVTAGSLSGNFSAADAVTGQASGNTFIYDEVGNFRFLDQAIRDTSFTLVDHAGDCVPNSFSNTPDATGRVGCGLANSGATDWVGRFTPDYFQLSTDQPGSLLANCVAPGFSYAGESIVYDLDPVLRATAFNSLGGITQNYTGDYMKLTSNSFLIPLLTEDAGNMGADGSSPVELGMLAGTRSLTDHGDGSMSLTLQDDQFAYSRSLADRVAPFVSAFTLQVSSVTDDDGVTASGVPYALSPDGVQIRHGRLALSNAHGSELQTLPVNLQVEHFAGPASGYVVSTDDSCTIAAPVTISDGDAGDSLLPSETCVWDAGGYSGSSCVSAGAASAQYLGNPLNGSFNLNLKGPGLNNTGPLNVFVDAPDWLEFNWTGAVNQDPQAVVTFGLHNRPTNVIYLRKVH